MSASETDVIERLIDETGLDPLQAQEFADAMAPIQDISGVGSSLGSVMEGIDAPGPRLVGNLLQQAATQIEMLSLSAETVARAVEVYFEAQAGSFETVFPPPDKLGEQVTEDALPLVRAIENLSQ